MKTLLIMRHAKSSWDNPAQDDHDRPLNARGRRDAPRMARWLAEHDLLPDLIVTSSARRARETAELMSEHLPYDGDPEVNSRLYHASPATWGEVIRALPDSTQRALCIAHNPGIEQLVTALADQPTAIPTAAVTRVELEIGRWAEFSTRCSCRVTDVWRPREIAADADDE